jgi:hypothetical protein
LQSSNVEVSGLRGFSRRLGLDSLQTFCALDPVVALQDERGIPTQWHLSEIPMAAGYSMALATEGGRVRHVSFRL